MGAKPVGGQYPLPGNPIARFGVLFVVSVHHYATELFNNQMQDLLGTALELHDSSIRPSRYILLITEEIGQDLANDVSHIAIVYEHANGEQSHDEILVNQRLFYEHALAIACAHALVQKIDVVMWQKNLQYAWT